MGRVWRKIRWSVAQRGLWGSVRAVAKLVGRGRAGVPVPAAQAGEQGEWAGLREPHPFDVEYGTDTGGFMVGGDLGAGHRHDRFITGYVGIAPSRFVGAIHRWQESGLRFAVEEYAFVDIGCGKGRVVLLASQAGFREVLGIELNPALAEVARENVERWAAAGRGRTAIRIEEGDATEVSWPAGPCVMYMYNPFGMEVVRRLAQRIRDEFPAGEGLLDLLYQNPEQAGAFDEGFTRLWSEAIAMSEEEKVADPVAGAGDECIAYRR